MYRKIIVYIGFGTYLWFQTSPENTVKISMQINVKFLSRVWGSHVTTKEIE